MKMNNANIKKITLPEKGQTFYWSDDLKGLGIRATPGGLAYVAQRRVNGRTVRQVLGSIGELSPTQAMDKAAKALSEMRSGTDINHAKADREKQLKAQSVTLQQAFEAFLDSRPNLRPHTLRTYHENINRTLADWLDLPLTSITKDMVQKRHHSLSNANGPRGKGTASANQSMRLLRVIFNHAAITYEDANGQPVITDNPVKRLSQISAWNKLQPRDNVIHEDDLAAWYKATMSLENDVLRDYILFLLLTGLRRSECLQLQWSYVDTKKTKVLTLPADITKTGKKRQLPLTDLLLDILERRRSKMVVGNPYIFTGKDGIKHLVEPRCGINAVRKETKLTWSLHDLRRTFATIASRLDISYYKLKHLLGHTVSGDVTGNHYVQVDVETLRPEMQKITDYFRKQMKIDDAPQMVSTQ